MRLTRGQLKKIIKEALGGMNSFQPGDRVIHRNEEFPSHGISDFATVLSYGGPDGDELEVEFDDGFTSTFQSADNPAYSDMGQIEPRPVGFDWYMTSEDDGGYLHSFELV